MAEARSFSRANAKNQSKYWHGPPTTKRGFDFRDEKNRPASYASDANASGCPYALRVSSLGGQTVAKGADKVLRSRWTFVVRRGHLRIQDATSFRFAFRWKRLSRTTLSSPSAKWSFDDSLTNLSRFRFDVFFEEWLLIPNVVELRSVYRNYFNFISCCIRETKLVVIWFVEFDKLRDKETVQCVIITIIKWNIFNHEIYKVYWVVVSLYLLVISSLLHSFLFFV